jgi:predicted CopG family antitoxin
MQKKLTITLDETVYDGLHRVIGRRRISRFIEELVRPHILAQDLEVAYQHMAQDETREAEALAWSEATELIPIIRALSDSEKVQLFDMLKAELAREDSIAPLEHEKTYPVWTPYGAYGAARVLLNALQEAQQHGHA